MFGRKTKKTEDDLLDEVVREIGQAQFQDEKKDLEKAGRLKMKVDFFEIVEGLYESGYHRSIFQLFSTEDGMKAIIEPVSENKIMEESKAELHPDAMGEMMYCAFYASSVSPAKYHLNSVQTTTTDLPELPDGRERKMLSTFLPSIGGGRSMICEVFTLRSREDDAKLVHKIAQIGKVQAFAELLNKLDEDHNPRPTQREILEFKSMSIDAVLMRHEIQHG